MICEESMPTAGSFRARRRWCVEVDMWVETLPLVDNAAVHGGKLAQEVGPPEFRAGELFLHPGELQLGDDVCCTTTAEGRVDQLVGSVGGVEQVIRLEVLQERRGEPLVTAMLTTSG
eukprot:11228287-Lingulodinium_polyedra.AAC.4